MSKTVIRTAVMLVAATALDLAQAGAAHAKQPAANAAARDNSVANQWAPNDAPQGRPSKGSYILTVTTQTGQQSLATLSCKPNGGIHPYKRKACAQLVKVDGDIAAIPPADGLCTMEYAPVLVRAEGAWDGTPYVYENVFSNHCVANLQTGGYVFNI